MLFALAPKDRPSTNARLASEQWERMLDEAWAPCTALCMHLHLSQSFC